MGDPAEGTRHSNVGVWIVGANPGCFIYTEAYEKLDWAHTDGQSPRQANMHPRQDIHIYIHIYRAGHTYSPCNKTAKEQGIPGRQINASEQNMHNHVGTEQASQRSHKSSISSDSGGWWR